MNAILLAKREVTPRYIRDVKDKYNLSWADMDAVMRYAPRSRASYHAYTYPEKFLNARFKHRFIAMVSKLEKDRGHTFEITNLIKRVLPKRFRIAGEPRRCKGHNEPTFELPSSGYCSDECKALAKAKGAKRK